MFIDLFHYYLKIVHALTILVFHEELLRLYIELSRMLLGDLRFFCFSPCSSVSVCVCLQLPRDTCLVCVAVCERRLWIKWCKKVKIKGESKSWVHIVYHHSLCCSDLQDLKKNNDEKATQTTVRFEQDGWFSFCACLFP